MTTSIFEHSDGISIVVVTWETGEHHIFDIIETGGREELDQIDLESFLGNVVFSYALLDNPIAADEEISDQYDIEDEFAY